VSIHCTVQGQYKERVCSGDAALTKLFWTFVYCYAFCRQILVEDQEEDQRGPGERLYDRTVKHLK